MIALKQSPVYLDVIEHRYWLGEKELKGVTSTLVERAFPKDKEYAGVSEDTLRRAANKGTRIHEMIEAYEEEAEFCADPELASYIRMKDEHCLAHVASEYIVSDEERYASPIDIVYEDKDGKVVIADIKTNYRPNYEKTALQLSIYKRFFERQNPGLKVDRCVLFWLRGEASEYRVLPVWADEALDALIDADIKGEPFDIVQTYGDFPAAFAKVESELVRIEVETKAMKARRDELHKGLFSLMERYNVKKWTGGEVSLTRVLPAETVTFDTKAFKADHPELYAQYSKKGVRAGSLKVTVKD